MKEELVLPEFLNKKQKEQINFAIENDIPIIISGKQGPTGKTFLAKILRKNGALVYEEWECQFIKLDNSVFD